MEKKKNQQQKNRGLKCEIYLFSNLSVQNNFIKPHCLAYKLFGIQGLSEIDKGSIWHLKKVKHTKDLSYIYFLAHIEWPIMLCSTRQ